MKKIDRDPFSNGTSYMIWEERNCDRCWKSSHLRKDEDSYTIIRCAIQRDIITRMYSNEPIALRTIEICSKPNCPFRQEKRKKYEKDKSLPKLF